MKLALYSKLAWRNLKANKQLQVPFVLATSLIFAMLYIVASLVNNAFVIERHRSLTTLMSMAMVVIFILCLIFTFYGQSFLARRRSKEFSLYSILGFEKIHISMVILVEQLINFLMIGFLAVTSGHLIGTVLFKLLHNLLKDSGASIGDYPISWFSVGIVLMTLAGTLIFLYIIQTLKVSLLNPIELMSQDKVGEDNQKFFWVKLILGVILLFIGYYLAWTTKGLLDSLMIFFVAVILVMAGTYLLFMTLISAVLRKLQKNKGYYYKTQNFLSISGMIYRIRSNAISLASIAILSTGFMLALGSTISIYNSIEDSIKLTLKKDYQIALKDQAYFLDEGQLAIEAKAQQAQSLADRLKELEGVKDLSVTETLLGHGKIGQGSQSLVTLSDNEQLSTDQFFMLEFMTVDDYNELYGTNHQLDMNQVLVNDLNESLELLDQLELNGQFYDLVQNTDTLYTNIVVDYALIVVPDRTTLMDISNHYKLVQNESFTNGDFLIAFNAEQDRPEFLSKVEQIFSDQNIVIKNRSQVRLEIYEVNGGFLFIGAIIGMVLLIGTVLMIYYKQITEGYDDQANFKIMKQVGLPDEMIKATIKQQTFWLFALPIIVAVIHGLGASKIIYRLLGLFGIHQVSQFAVPYLIVILIFVVAYYLIYLVTSRVYYQIVNEEAGDL